MKEKILLYIIIALLAAFSANTYREMIKTKNQVSALEKQEISRQEINQNTETKINEIKLKQQELKATIEDTISKQNSILTWTNNIHENVTSSDETIKKLNNSQEFLTFSIKEIQKGKIIYRLDILEEKVKELKYDVLFSKEDAEQLRQVKGRVDSMIRMTWSQGIPSYCTIDGTIQGQIDSLKSKMSKVEQGVWGISGEPTAWQSIQQQIDDLKRNIRTNY